jgi:hypothetical protein
MKPPASAKPDDGVYEQEPTTKASGYAVAVLLFVGVIVLPFLPLLCAVVEGALFGTRRVEDFFSWIGLHDELSWLYEKFGIR